MEQDFFNQVNQKEEMKTLHIMLRQIFHSNQNNDYCGIIHQIELIPFLLTTLHTIVDVDIKLYVVELFSKLFNESPCLIHIFNNCELQGKSFSKLIVLEQVLHFYYSAYDSTVNDEMMMSMQHKTLELFNAVISNSDIPHQIFEIIFKRIASIAYTPLPFAINSHKEKDEVRNDNQVKLLLRPLIEFRNSIELLQVLYGKTVLKQKPKNYLYFTGNGRLEVNVKGSYFSFEQSKMEFWFYCEYDYSLLLLNKDIGVKESTLMCIQNENNQMIEIILATNNVLYLKNCTHKKAIETIIPKQWYKVILYLKSTLFKDTIYFIKVKATNGSDLHQTDKDKDKDALKYDSLNGYNYKIPIQKLIFFENFIGRAGSIALFTNSNESAEYLQLPYGIYKEKILVDLIKPLYPLFFKVKNSSVNSNNSGTNKVINSSNKKQEHSISKDNLSLFKFLFVPFHYEARTNSLDDTVSHLTAKFRSMSELSNGVALNRKLYKKIQLIGGLFALLPILEKLFLLINKSLKDLDESALEYQLIHQILTEYLRLILVILSNSRNNRIQTKTFFSVFSLYLIKLPKCLFTNEVLEVLIKISSQFEGLETLKSYYNHILLNERILFKYSLDIQTKLWEYVFTEISITPQHLELINLSRICMILKTYDDSRYNEYCCVSHKDLFTLATQSQPQSQPLIIDLMTKLAYLKSIILFVLKHNPTIDSDINNTPPNPNATLFKLLALDLSPCMQKFIIEVFYDHFKDNHVAIDQKKATAKSILENNGVDIVQYVMSVCLIDVKVSLVQFLQVLLCDFRSLIYAHFTKDAKKLNVFLCFIKENITTKYMEIDGKVIDKNNEANDSKDRDKDKERMSGNDNKTVIVNADDKGDLDDEDIDKDNNNIQNIRDKNNDNDKDDKQEIMINQDEKENVPKQQNSFIKAHNLKRYSFSNTTIKKSIINDNDKDKDNDIQINEPQTNILNNNDKYHHRKRPISNQNRIKHHSIYNESIDFFNKDNDQHQNQSNINSSIFSLRETLVPNSKDYVQCEKFLRIKLSANKRYLNNHLNPIIYKNQLKELIAVLIQWLSQLLQEAEPTSQQNPLIKVSKKEQVEKHLLNNILTSFVLNLIINISADSHDFEIITLMIKFMANLFEINKNKNAQERFNNKPKDIPETFAIITKINLTPLFYNTQLLFHWVIEVSFQCFLTKQLKDYHSPISNIRENKEASLTSECQFIIEKLFFEDTKLYDNASSVLTNETERKIYSKFNFILTWGVYQNCLHANDQLLLSQIGVFLHMLIKGIIYKYNENFISLNNFVQDESVYSSFYSLSFLLYEYLLLYNNNNKIFKDFKIYCSISSDQALIPSYLFDGLSKTMTESYGKIEYLWLDYKTFQLIFNNLKHIWSYKNKILKVAGYSLDPNVNANVNKPQSVSGITITKKQIDFVIEELVYNKKKKGDIDLNRLLSPIDPNKTKEEQSPLIIIISNLVSITLSLMLDKDKDEAKSWILDYKEFLLFCIIAICNIKNSHDSEFTEKQKNIYQVLQFGFNFLIEMAFMGHYQTEYQDALVLITYVISRILVAKKAKDKSFAIKAKQLEICYSAVYLLYQDFVFSDDGISYDLFLYEELESFNTNQGEINTEAVLAFIKKRYDANLWSKSLVNTKKLFKTKQFLFNEALFEKICRRRFEEISNIVPFFKVKSRRQSANDIAIKLSPYYVPCEYVDEKIRLQESIKALVPCLLKQIYENNAYSSYIKKIRLYKKIKKRLFSWLGIWSNKELFFGNDQKDKQNANEDSLLKFKLLNHYAKDYSMPLLKPILDLEHFFPLFSSFNPSAMFIKEKGNDIEKSKDKDKENHCLNNSVKSDIYLLLEDSIKNNEDELNYRNNSPIYLKSLYKCVYNSEIWESYDLNVNITDPNGLVSKLKRLEYINEEHGYACCHVKITHHIKGKLYFLQNKLRFSTPYKVPTDHTLINYDSERKACYGSFFSKHKSNEDHNCLTIHFNEIAMIIKRSYYYQKVGLELFTTFNRSYLFLFSTEKKRKKVISKFDFLEMKPMTIEANNDDIIGYEKKSSFSSLLPSSSKDTSHHTNNEHKKSLHNKNNNLTEGSNLKSIIFQWKNWKISTFEFLIKLNLYANRSYIDLNQYPVFPWVLTNYSRNELSFPDDLRQLHLPMGLLTINERSRKRTQAYIDQYDGMKMENSEDLISNNIEESMGIFNFDNAPYCFGSHYSNAVYVSHYLVRLFPFSSISIELQGNNFDNTNRLFLSIESSFDSASTQKMDVRELCPQFYYLPEMFHNLNRLNFGIVKKKDKNLFYQLMEVTLPPWANNSPIDFIKTFKETLELQSSQTIHYWIDLIFGSKQRGRKAEKFFNLFLPYSYDYSIDLTKLTEKDKILCIMRILEMGMTPNQIMINDLDERNPKPPNTFFDQDHPLKYFKFPHALTNYPIHIKVINDTMLYIVGWNYQIEVVSFIRQNNDKEPIKIRSVVSFNTIPKESRPPISLELKSCFYDSNNQCAVIYKKGAYLALGGFWDGRLIISELEEGKAKRRRYKFVYCLIDPSPITIIVLNKEESTAYCGSKSGSIIVYQIDELKWTYLCKKHYHQKEITSIAINDSLNVLATASFDGYVMLFTLPSLFNYRVIKMNEASVNHVFLSSSPVPSVVLYSIKLAKYYSYSINGLFYKEVHEDENNKKETNAQIYSPRIVSDIYGNSQGKLVCRKFPSMEVQFKDVLFDKASVYFLEVTNNFKSVFAMSGKEIKVCFINKKQQK